MIKQLAEETKSQLRNTTLSKTEQRSVLTMTRFWIASSLTFALLIAAIPARSDQRAAPPDAGITNEELAELGPRAIPLLIGRLKDPAQEKYYDGLVHRLSVISLEYGPNAELQDALQEFVEINAGREEVPFDTVMAIYHALQAMGYVGGEAGVDYLIDWVRAGHQQKVKATAENKKAKVEVIASELRDAAVLGLGFSGDPKAREFLEEQAEKKPDVPYKGSFQGVVKAALKYNREVEKRGAKEYVLPTLNWPWPPEQKPSKEN